MQTEMQMLRVVMVISSFTPIIGGAERQTHQLGKALVARGVQVSVLTRRYPGLPAQEQLDGLTVYRLPVVGNGRNALSALLYTLGLLFWLLRYRRTYDVVHAHQPLSPANAALIAKFVTGKPTLVKVTGSGAYGSISILKALPLLRLRTWLLRQSTALLVLDQESVGELTALGFAPDQLVAIFNGVDTEGFHSCPHQRAAPDSLQVIYVGRLAREKGVDLLLQSWQMVCQQVADPAKIYLTILGNGPDEAKLLQLAATLGVESSVTFAGAVTNVAERLQQADLFVLPSYSEGMPNALLEAMACGLPVVSTAVGSVPQIITAGENGLLAKPGDATDLAKQLLCLLHNENLRVTLGQRAVAHIQAHYSLAAAAEHHLALYSSVK